MTEPSFSPAQALAELRAGNDRFVSGTRVHPNQDAEHRTAVAEAQTPFAVMFGCSDSRLAAEIIFDRGLGDLFVVRTVGHTVGPEVLGSIEYAVTALDVPLVVVLGHNNCGAVRAARDVFTDRTELVGHLRTVVDSVVPSVRFATTQHVEDIDGIVEIHTRRIVDHLLAESDPLAKAVTEGRCAVVGMYYQLSDGRVRIITAGE